jgi:hypothetical protein
VGVRVFFEANASTDSKERSRMQILKTAATDRDNGIFGMSRGATLRRKTTTTRSEVALYPARSN